MLGTHSLLSAATSEADTASTPFDVRCKKLCMAEPDCAVAHVFAATFQYHDLALRSPPPPSPPSPPSAPPPTFPPYPPLPPVPPPDEFSGYRVWRPGVLDVPEYDDDLEAFKITCRVARCGQPHLVYASGSQLAAHSFVRELIENGVYSRSLCPYECQRVVRSHGLSDEDEAAIRDGVGSQTAAVQYPGYLDDPVNGLATYAHKATAAAFAQTAMPIYKRSGLTMAQCGKEMHDHKILAMHGLWVYNHTTPLAARVGECAFYLVARSTLQLNVWKGFTEYAKEILDLAHMRARVPEQLISAVAAPSKSLSCDEGTSKVCMFWSEFDLDHKTEIGCFPAVDGSNIATPTVLLTELGSAGIACKPPGVEPCPFRCRLSLNPVCAQIRLQRLRRRLRLHRPRSPCRLWRPAMPTSATPGRCPLQSTSGTRPISSTRRPLRPGEQSAPPRLRTTPCSSTTAKWSAGAGTRPGSGPRSTRTRTPTSPRKSAAGSTLAKCAGRTTSASQSSKTSTAANSTTTPAARPTTASAKTGARVTAPTTNTICGSPTVSL